MAEVGVATLVEYVCLAKHTETVIDQGFTLTTHKTLVAYCARGGADRHEWIRVPATRVEEITISRMEDRPPIPKRQL